MDPAPATAGGPETSSNDCVFFTSITICTWGAGPNELVVMLFTSRMQVPMSSFGLLFGTFSRTSCAL